MMDTIVNEKDIEPVFPNQTQGIEQKDITMSTCLFNTNRTDIYIPYGYEIRMELVKKETDNIIENTNRLHEVINSRTLFPNKTLYGNMKDGNVKISDLLKNKGDVVVDKTMLDKHSSVLWYYSFFIKLLSYLICIMIGIAVANPPFLSWQFSLICIFLLLGGVLGLNIDSIKWRKII